MKRRGFTLIELLAVMAVVMILASIVASSYFGITRGAGMRSSVSHLVATLNLARQMAIMHARPTYVFFDQDGTNAWYTVCMRESTATSSSGTVMNDQYAAFDSSLEGRTIYNLQTGGQAVIITVASKIKLLTDVGIWGGASGGAVPYGWEVSPQRQLARGFLFGQGSMSLPTDVQFDAKGMTPSYDVEIDIYEKINPGTYLTVTVSALTGKVVAP
jgi:prepilin-type N-terminal cleavage/methylation domain-containing protein